MLVAILDSIREIGASLMPCWYHLIMGNMSSAERKPPTIAIVRRKLINVSLNANVCDNISLESKIPIMLFSRAA